MTPSFALRVPTQSDAIWLHAILNHAATNHALIDLAHPYPLADVERHWLSDTPRRMNRVLLRNETAIGHVWFGIDAAAQSADFSVVLNPTLQGQGIGRAALAALWPGLRVLVSARHSITHVTAHTRPDNAASAALLRHCGFVHDATLAMNLVNSGGKTTLSRFMYVL